MRDPKLVQLGKVMRAARRHIGHSQEVIASRMGCTRQHVSAFENGRALPHPATWARWLAAVGASSAPDEGDAWQHELLQRAKWLFAEAQPDLAVSLPPPAPVPSPTVEPPRREGDWVQRRDFVGLAGRALAGSILQPSEILSELAVAMTRYQQTEQAGTADEPDPRRLGHGVQQAKLAYQACRYAAVADHLPRLLAHLEAAAEQAPGDARLQVAALTAEAYHVAASVLLKLESHGLAWVAADRSMQAAQRSGDPVIIAASARIVTHALMSAGHHAPASALAARAATRLDTAVPRPTPASLSVYGALLLRGAIAAARNEDGGTARQLLDEADASARRLGGNHNHQWTAFGAANVLAHRVHIELALGNAGTAIDHARRLQLDKLGITERKAAVLLDTAHAYIQWGKFDRAITALSTAERLAPQELRLRPAAHDLVTQLRHQAPASVQRRAAELAEKVGVA